MLAPRDDTIVDVQVLFLFKGGPLFHLMRINCQPFHLL